MPGTTRFSAEDPIKNGGNWYGYCGGNPLKYIDPLGLISYIIYDPDTWEGDLANHAHNLAEIMQRDLTERYGTETKLIPTTSADQFAENWNSMGSSGNIDAVVILGHSSPNLLEFRYDDDKTFFRTNQVGGLTSHTMDVLMLLGCNTAHSNVSNNIANAFFNHNTIAAMIAADGTTFHRRTSELVGNSNWFTRLLNLDRFRDVYSLDVRIDEFWTRFASEDSQSLGFLLFLQGLENPIELGHSATFGDLLNACRILD